MTKIEEELIEALKPHKKAMREIGDLRLRCENPKCGKYMERPWFDLATLGVIVCSQTCKQQVEEDLFNTTTFHPLDPS